MYRRTCLSLVAACSVPLAGCGDNGNGESSGDSDGDNGDAAPADGVDTTGNRTGGDGGNSDDDPSEDGPAQENIDAAQSALQDAVDELTSQGTGTGSLSSEDDRNVIDGSISDLSDDPIRDHLSATASAISDAREYDLTSGQESILAAIEAAKDWLHTLLDTQPVLHELYLEAHYGVRDFAAEDEDPDVEAIRSRANEAESPVESLRNEGEKLPDLTDVDAVSVPGVEQQIRLFEAEFTTSSQIVDVLDQVVDAEEEFWTGYDEYHAEEYADAQETLDPVMETFNEAQTTLSQGTHTFIAATGYLHCYLPAMEDAAIQYDRAAETASVGDEAFNEERESDGAEALEKADGCSFEWQ